jgi:hypothetical protein
MDPAEREIALLDLAATEEVLARTRTCIARLAKLECGRHDAAEGRKFLANLEAARANHERRLATLLNELRQRGWKQEAPHSS